MADYTKAATNAANQIAANGKTLVLRSFVTSGTSFNPTVTETDTNVIGVVLNIKAGLVDGTLIQKGDKMILFAASVAPSQDDKIVDGSTIYSIVHIEELNPGGTTILYKVQVRA